MRVLGLAVLCGVLSGAYVHAMLDEAYLNTDSKFFFLTKFCFRQSTADGLVGYYDVETLSTPSNPNTKFAIYSDEEDSWPATYHNGKHKSCEEITKTQEEGGPAIAVFQNASLSFVPNDSRPRYWFVAAFECEKGIESIRYKIRFRQEASHFYREFSFEKRGALSLYIAFFVLFAILAIVHAYGLLPMYRSRTTHPIVNLVTASVAMQVLSTAFYLIHYSVYAANGIGSPGTAVLAGVLDVCSQVVFIGLLLLIAKGWSITHHTLQDKPVLLVVLAIFVFQYFALFVWDVAKRDRADTRYVYETVPGIVVLCVRAVVLFWFLWCIVATYRAETSPEKKSFYRQFGFAFTLWFLALPFIAAVAAAVKPWHRETLVGGFTMCFNWAFLSLVTVLLWPSRATRLLNPTTPNQGLMGSTVEPYEDL